MKLALIIWVVVSVHAAACTTHIAIKDQRLGSKERAFAVILAFLFWPYIIIAVSLKIVAQITSWVSKGASKLSDIMLLGKWK
jgi:hypothetical protein